MLPYSRHSHWLIRGWDFPRLQLAILALVLLVCEIIWLDFGTPLNWLLVGVTTVCFAAQMWWIVPYTRLYRVEVKAASDEVGHDNRLSIITANVHTRNRSADALLELVAQHEPDILVTLESNQWWQERLDTLLSSMPHAVRCPLDNLYGMHVYSRLPLQEAEIEYLVEEDIPSIHALVRLHQGTQVRMHFLHPAPPSPTENEVSTERDAELIIVARSVAQCDTPVVVTGDLNDVAWSATTRLFRKISGLLDPRIGRGMFNTFHADYPFARWPLDHLFHSDHFTVQHIERLPHFDSDHFALLTRLCYEPARGAARQGLTPDAQDHARAQTPPAKEGVDAQDVPSP